MANQIRMTPDTMRRRASQTDKQSEAMQNLINTMDKLLATLKDEWEGDAMRGYETDIIKIKPSFKNAKDLLDEIAHNLRETARIVEETDQNIANQFRSKKHYMKMVVNCRWHQAAIHQNKNMMKL